MPDIDDEAEVRGHGKMKAISGLIPINIIDNDNVNQMKEYLNAGGSPNFKFTGMPLLAHAHSVEMAKLLIDRGADLHYVGLSGMTPFLEHAMYKRIDIMKLLLDTDPTLIYDNAGLRGYNANALYLCISEYYSTDGYDKQLECVKVLLANEPKIDVNMRFPVIYTSDDPTVLNKAVRVDHTDIIKLLLEHGAKPELAPGYEKYPGAKIVKQFLLNSINNTRNIPRGATNGISIDEIQEENIMVNFPRNNTRTEYNYNSYLKNTPYIRGLRLNPYSRRALTNTNFKVYKAHLVNENILGNNPLSAINTSTPGTGSRKTLRRRQQRARAKAREIQSKVQTRKSRKSKK
jgi:ankyrin repeat protein